jgi:phosphoribosylformimino-5-aminoimidazole carboxamide ribotide isomerase
MRIYPAIDIKHGSCVRLTQGLEDQETEYFHDPLEPARIFKAAGAEWVHVVDLDGAFNGKPANFAIVEQIAALGLKVEFGGGIRELVDAEALLEAGVSRIVVGTRACKDHAFVEELLKRWPEQLAIGIDAREGKVAVRGWVEVTDMPAISFAQKLAEAGVQRIIYTDISTDGMMVGPNFEGQEEMLNAVPIQVIASGGVSDLHDLTVYTEMAARCPNLDGVIVGKALYEKKFTVKEALDVAAATV